MNTTVNAPRAAPVRKVVAATIGGAIATIVVFVLGELGVVLNDTVTAAIVTLVTALVGYLTPAAASDVTGVPIDLAPDDASNDDEGGD